MKKPASKIIQKFPNLANAALKGVIEWIYDVTRIRDNDVTLAAQVNQRLDALEGVPMITGLASASGSIALDLANSGDFSHTFTEDTTLANPSNATVGQRFSIFLTQHASSPKTLAYDTEYKFPAGVTPSVTATNGALDRLDCIVRSASVIDSNLVKGLA